MISLKLRLITTTLMLCAQITILLSGIYDRNVPVTLTGCAGIGLAIIIGLIFYTDYRTISVQKALTAQNAENIKNINEQMDLLRPKLHNQE